MDIERRHIIGVGLGGFILIMNVIFLRSSVWFIPLIIIAITLGWAQFWLDYFIKRQREKEIEARFPDFVRNLVGTVNSGMPISKALIYVANTDYGPLTPFVKKMANQLEWSMPLHSVLMRFAINTKSDVIRRAMATVIEAEESGGNIEDVLETVTDSVIKIKQIRQKRRSSIHAQIIESYIIFLVFLTVMIVVQNLVVPYVAGLEGKSFIGGVSESLTSTQSVVGTLAKEVNVDYSSLRGFIVSFASWLTSLKGIFLLIGLIQGFFSGLVIGKLSEADIYAGLKHSLILITIAFLVITFSQAF